QPGAVKLRTANGGPGAGPKILHDIHGSGSLSGFKKHAIPGWCALLFMPPKKHIGADTLIAIRLNHLLESFLIMAGFDGAVVFDRRAPLGFSDLPMAGRTPLSH